MKNNKNETVQVVKSVHEELKQATFIVLAPNEVDLQGDIASEAEVRKACYNFNKYSNQANLFHITKTATFEFAESFIAPVDFVLGNTLVSKGTWLATVQVLNDDLWELVKTGEVNGLSISALASTEKVEDDN